MAILLSRSWRRHWLSLVVWLLFCILAFIYNFSLSVVMTNTPGYGTLLTNPPVWLRFATGSADPSNPSASFLMLTTIQSAAPFIWLLLLCKLAIDETAGEEISGALDFFLSHPFTRRKFLLAKLTELLITTFLMGIILWASLSAVVLISKIPLGIDFLAEVVLFQTLFVLWGSTLAALLGCMTGKPELSGLLAALAMIITWVLEGFVRLGLLPETVGWFSPYGMSLIKPTITPWVGAVMVGLIIINCIGAWLIWDRRNFMHP